MGENVAELIIDIGSSLRQGKDKVEEDEKLVFFDVLGLFMVSSKISLNNQIGAHGQCIGSDTLSWTVQGSISAELLNLYLQWCLKE